MVIATSYFISLIVLQVSTILALLHTWAINLNTHICAGLYLFKTGCAVEKTIVLEVISALVQTYLIYIVFCFQIYFPAHRIFWTCWGMGKCVLFWSSEFYERIVIICVPKLQVSMCKAIKFGFPWNTTNNPDSLKVVSFFCFLMKYSLSIVQNWIWKPKMIKM